MSDINVNAGENLQSAINSAKAGDVLQLESGATWQGPFNLGTAAGVTIRSRTTVPAPGQRCLPSMAGGFAKIRASSSEPALRNRGAAAQWAMLGLEVIGHPTSNSNTMDFGPDSADLIIDRCFVHGDPVGGAKRGVGCHSAGLKITNSTFLDFKRQGQDTQAISGAQGPGPYLIENNWCEASGENILFGGDDPKIPNLIPSDIVIRRNYLKKPVVWHSRTWSTQWSVKNLFELKNAQRVLIEENVFENNWLHSQTGVAILFTVRNQSGTAPWCTIKDVTFRNNVIRNSCAALAILGSDDGNTSVRMQNLKVIGNMFYNMDPQAWGRLDTGEWGNNKMVQIYSGRNGGPDFCEIANNHFLNSAHPGSFLSITCKPPAAQLNLHHNIFYEGQYGIVGDGTTGLGLPAWTPNVDTASAFKSNLIKRGGVRNITYPPGNTLSQAGELVVDNQYMLLPQFANTGAGCNVEQLTHIAKVAAGITL